MEVHFTHEQEALLSQIARHAGIDSERLVQEATLRVLANETRFRAAVREGLAQADRGEFLEEAEMDALLEQNAALIRNAHSLDAGRCSGLAKH